MIPEGDANMDANIDKVNEAVERLSGLFQDSYKKALENTVAARESNARLTRSLLEANIEALKAQAEIQAEFNRNTLESLAEGVRKNREAFLGLSRGSLNAYEGFLDSLSSYHDEVSERPET